MSGGRWITAANNLETVLADVVAQNTTAYVLAFEAAQAHPRARTTSRSGVRRTGAQLFARRAYVGADTAGDTTAGAAAPTTTDAADRLRELARARCPRDGCRCRCSRAGVCRRA